VNAAEIAIIIDDMGNTPRDASAFNLPKEVAFSILPLTYLSERFSRRAAKEKREVMLHIPMEALSGKALGPGAITADMNPEQIRLMLNKALVSVPDAIGVNNHMGSKLTQLRQPMHTTMSFLTEKQLFFLDSRTTPNTVAEQIARTRGVLTTKRNVFLDHELDASEMEVQFQRLISLSKKYGTAVCIAHPYPESIKYLSAAIERLSEHNVRLIPISEIVKLQELARNQALGSNISISLD
jgi:polysaccharide deacetylase 2 family uncharacterized protein YibQ